MDGLSVRDNFVTFVFVKSWNFPFVSSVFQKPTFRFTLSSLCPAHVNCRLPSLNYIPWIILRRNRCKLRFVVLFFCGEAVELHTKINISHSGHDKKGTL